MKIRFIIIITVFITLLSFSRCKIAKSTKMKTIDSKEAPANEKIFKVLKIDSVADVYLIYAQNDSLVYKIASAKVKLSCTNKINVGGIYSFSINSVMQLKFANKNDISGIYFNEALIKFEGGNIVWDLFVSDNIKGLCYIPAVRSEAKNGFYK